MGEITERLSLDFIHRGLRNCGELEYWIRYEELDEKSRNWVKSKINLEFFQEVRTRWQAEVLFSRWKEAKKKFKISIRNAELLEIRILSK